jgi:hypothetical protein
MDEATGLLSCGISGDGSVGGEVETAVGCSYPRGRRSKSRPRYEETQGNLGGEGHRSLSLLGGQQRRQLAGSPRPSAGLTRLLDAVGRPSHDSEVHGLIAAARPPVHRGSMGHPSKAGQCWCSTARAPRRARNHVVSVLFGDRRRLLALLGIEQRELERVIALEERVASSIFPAVFSAVLPDSTLHKARMPGPRGRPATWAAARSVKFTCRRSSPEPPGGDVGSRTSAAPFRWSAASTAARSRWSGQTADG